MQVIFEKNKEMEVHFWRKECKYIFDKNKEMET